MSSEEKQQGVSLRREMKITRTRQSAVLRSPSVSTVMDILYAKPNTVEIQWLEHLWGYENLFETGVFRVIEGFIIEPYGYFFDFVQRGDSN